MDASCSRGMLHTNLYPGKNTRIISTWWSKPDMAFAPW